MYKSAAFWADKLVSIFNDPVDIYTLAKIHYNQAEYSRCEHLLSKSGKLNTDSVWVKLLLADCFLKLEKFDDIIALLDNDLFSGPIENGSIIANS
jgi:anaphase-promoting complex subunit 6